MKGNKLLRRIGGLVLAALLLSSVAILSATNSQAQWRGRGGLRGGRVRVVRPVRPFFRGYGSVYGYPYGYYNQFVFSSSQAADNQGYKDGLKTGSEDARKGKSNDPERLLSWWLLPQREVNEERG